MNEMFYAVPPGIAPYSKDEDGLPLVEDVSVFHESKLPRVKVYLQGKTKEEIKQNLLEVIRFLVDELEKQE